MWVIPKSINIFQGNKTLNKHHTNGVVKRLWPLMTTDLNQLIHLPLTGSFKKSFKFLQPCIYTSLECHSHILVYLVNPTQYSTQMSSSRTPLIFVKIWFTCLTQTKQLPVEVRAFLYKNEQHVIGQLYSKECPGPKHLHFTAMSTF